MTADQSTRLAVSRPGRSRSTVGSASTSSRRASISRARANRTASRSWPGSCAMATPARAPGAARSARRRRAGTRRWCPRFIPARGRSASVRRSPVRSASAGCARSAPASRAIRPPVTRSPRTRARTVRRASRSICDLRPVVPAERGLHRHHPRRTLSRLVHLRRGRGQRLRAAALPEHDPAARHLHGVSLRGRRGHRLHPERVHRVRAR